jgi:hypothetical protein
VDKSFLEALLDDVFGVFSDAAEAARNIQKPLLVTRDQNFKGPLVSDFGGSEKSGFFIPVRNVPWQPVLA